MAERQPIMFIAGPYRAATFAQLEANVKTAAQWAVKAKRKGWTPLCPHTNSHAVSLELFQECGPGDPSWSQDALALLERCDGILMIPHWQESEGAQKEHQFAKDKGLLVYYWQYAENDPSRGGIPQASDFWEAQRNQSVKDWEQKCLDNKLPSCEQLPRVPDKPDEPASVPYKLDGQPSGNPGQLDAKTEQPES